MVNLDRLEQFAESQPRHLFAKALAAKCSYVPMGFSPYTSAVDGNEYAYVWQIVLGSFLEFQQEIAQAFEQGTLLVSPNISIE